MRKPIYFDYAATTPVDPQVAEAMTACLTVDGNFGNPASRSHLFGWKAEEAVENARSQVAELIGADSREIVWTSGATESNNLAIKGLLEARAREVPKPHIITSAIEHKAVLDNCAHLQTKGVSITYLQPQTAADKAGVISPEELVAAITDNTVLISIMMVNNEIGVINDIRAIGKRLQAVNRTREDRAKILLHVDAAQAAGKVEIDVNAQHIDLLSLSAHKIYGPKGIGALYVRRAAHIQIAAQIHGGGHERGMRSGTLPTHQIVGMGAAAQLAKASCVLESQRIRALRERFLKGIKTVPAVYMNGALENRVPGNLNLSFAHVDGESLLMALRDIAVSTGSACTSASVEPSYVLKALGIEDKLAHAALRISLGRYTTEEEIDFAAEYIARTVARLRANTPEWKNFSSSPERANETGG